MIKNIIRELPPDCSDFASYFECDSFNEHSGDYNNTVFIPPNCNTYGYNAEEWEKVEQELEDIYCDYDNVGDVDGYKNIKHLMTEYGLEYSPQKANRLKRLITEQISGKTEDVAEYLSIKTGKPWKIREAHGYCQGDWCEIVYCADNYNEQEIREIGDIWLGCGKEFEVITLDDDGNEVDSCYGFIVADSSLKVWDETEYKRIVCEMDGLNPDETQLELIDGYKTVTKYSYKTVA